jgi:NAD(P)-dependent dehydrogenase (short-subunit alcohol dehydrogenase family)
MNAIDRVAVVTGAGRGIGLGLARLLADLGVAVVINDAGVALDGSPDDPGLAERVAAEIGKDGGRALWSARSIADPATAEELVALAQRAYGRLDAWVNAAAITSDRMLFNMTDDAWSKVIDTNLSGTFYGMRAALRHFKQARAGRLVNLVSTAGLVGNIGQANYAASKAGMAALTRVAALEMVRYGVAVNCVAPFACTRMTESIKGTTPEQQAYLERARRATVAAILPFLAYLLLSDAAATISGQIFGVRGHEVFLFSQPRPVCTIGQQGGWTLEALQRAVEAGLRPWLVPLQTDLELFQHEPLI